VIARHAGIVAFFRSGHIQGDFMQRSDPVHFKNEWRVQSSHKKHQYPGSKKSTKSNLREFDHETEKRCWIDLGVRFSTRTPPSHCAWFTGTGTAELAELQGISRIRTGQPAQFKSVRAYRHLGRPDLCQP
jgi:hypothetical protein